MSETTRTLANPVYAAVGAGDYVVAQFNDIVAQLRERTEAAGETAQTRFEETRSAAQTRLEETRTAAQTRLEETRSAAEARFEKAVEDAKAGFGETKTRVTALPEDVPATIEELRGKFSPEELRKIYEGYLEAATEFYNSLAERGEGAVERLRQQPLVQENIDRAGKVYNDAVDMTEDALGVVSSQTRLVGERAAKLTGRVSSKVEDLAADIEEAGETIKAEAAEAAEEIDGAAGTVEAKARTAKASPAKKAPAKKAPAKKAAPAAESTDEE
ncbi:hypothetical protein [Gordonia rhizosphera]|uniref:Heparin-binding hemagglutinin n=1 Tax=Gordonia rhizosphera NBRC 16068 TaxID=1108045 RepID=K6UZL2_9ACTN|nr:hypothetical protein [Gordonia rhizosphera]GAB88948.1 hypothetical protein GORHZ_046_00980 [Gordonia rhizosphera NBRC 16068]